MFPEPGPVIIIDDVSNIVNGAGFGDLSVEGKSHLLDETIFVVWVAGASNSRRHDGLCERVDRGGLGLGWVVYSNTKKSLLN